MNTPILFSAPDTCSLASIVALEWLDEPYRPCRLDTETFGGENYERLNPQGQDRKLNEVLSKVGAGKINHFKTLTSGRLLDGSSISSRSQAA